MSMDHYHIFAINLHYLVIMWNTVDTSLIIFTSSTGRLPAVASFKPLPTLYLVVLNIVISYDEKAVPY